MLIEAALWLAKLDGWEETYCMLKSLHRIHEIEKLPSFNTQRETFEMAARV